MDQNRSESTTSQQQNVHLHMHHVCNCQGNVYPAYYPAVGYRTPVPPMVTYQAPPVPRPYLQHYQYAQFNVGGQYSVPIAHVAASGPVYGATTPASDMVYGRDRRDKGGSLEVDRSNEPGGGAYDYGQITQPASELLLAENAENTTPDNFVKFLERSCLTAEQIAYRNRNRPCFRNIQNLCIRTRSEILKPCTTISNIHSQGIPWATKDFIYAFVRLTNCWHILKGYWENRDGSSLGKIEKELTPEFRACYVRWEKETIDLAAQLTRVFYNLDTNLVSPQVNVMKAANAETAANKMQLGENSISTSTLTNMSVNNPNKNVRGIIHLPATPVAVAETVDQANQTYSGDFCAAKEDNYDSEDERRVYMKPGSYCVPKKEGNDSSAGTAPSPRAIEFLETAQNVNKAQTANDRYWANVGAATGSSKKPTVAACGDAKFAHEMTSKSDLELSLSTHLNVHEWLLTSNFSDFGEPSPVSSSTQDLRPFFVETSSTLYDAASVTHQLTGQELDSCKSTSVLQRPNTFILRGDKDVAINGHIQDITGKCLGQLANKTTMGIYETGDEGITDTGVIVLENLLLELKKYDILEGLDASDKNFYAPVIDIETMMSKLKNEEYVYINEVVRDLKYLINYYNVFAENFNNVDNKKKELVIFITEMFSLKLRDFLLDTFPGYDFSDVKGDVLQLVGPLKIKMSKFSGEEDQFL